MQTAKFTPGMIYLVKNQFEEKIGLQTTQHNYIVLGTIMNGRNSKFQMVQAMNITSNPQHGDDVSGKAVPVLLSNGAISWILPYNIHSISFNDMESGKFHGIIQDSSYCTTERFVQMLVDLYNDELGLGFINHDIIMKEYNDYCDWFYKEHEGFKTYRELSGKEKYVKGPSLFVDKAVLYKDSTKTLVKAQKKYDREEDEMKGEQIIPTEIDSETEKTGPDYETVYSSDPTPMVMLKIPPIVTLNDKKRRVRKHFKSAKEMNAAEKRCISGFSQYPKRMVDWTNDQIRIFINAFDTYGPTAINNNSGRWGDPSSVSYTYRQAVSAANERMIALH